MLRNSGVKISIVLSATAIFCLFSCNRIMALENNAPSKKIVQKKTAVSSNLVKKQLNNKKSELLIKNKSKAVVKQNTVNKKSVPVMSQKTDNKNGVGTFCMPVSGTITSSFGYRKLTMPDGSVSSEIHEGLDIAAAMGTKISAAFGGTVKFAGVQSGYGNTIILSHANGIETLYGHCSKLNVKIGETVNKGETIAEVGSTGRSTGPHVHFEVRLNGKAVNPVNYLMNSNVTEN